MKVLQVGSDSVHFTSFCKAILPFTGEMVTLTESSFEIPGSARNYCIAFRSKNPLTLLVNYRKLASVLKTERPELIHIHQVNRLAFVVSKIAAQLNIPVITTAWGSDVLLIPLKNRFFQHLTRRTLQRSSIVTGDSGEMLEVMNRLAPGPKYVLLQYGIDPVIPGKKENIIYSNRLHKKLYRIDQIIREFAAFSKSNPDWKLIIGGSGDETDDLRGLVNQLGIDQMAEFTGWLNKTENDRLYGISRIYISIPKSDGTSVSLLEAMSANCIPVVSDLAVSREWIANGENGVIYDEALNPFFAALGLDESHCFDVNARLIEERALRKNTVKQFYDLYLRLQ